MRLRHLISDVRKIAEGAAAWLRYAVTEDPVTIGLGQLSAEFPVALRGRPNRYAVTITNATAEGQEVTLSMDIYPLEFPGHPARHYAFFFRRLKARARASTRIEVDYDWGTKASFVVDDDGQRLELITIYQRLAP